MINKLVVCSKPPQVSYCSALMRVVDHGDVSINTSPQVAYASEYTLAATRFTDMKKSIDWLRSLAKLQNVDSLLLVVNCTYISADDVACVIRVLYPNIQIEYADGREQPLIIPMEERSEDPFEDGMIASLAGLDVSANPYIGGEQNCQWEAGVEASV